MSEELEPGALFGPYEVIALLGQGGMGQVYRARDQRLSREVALKIVRAEQPADKASLRRFTEEARATSLLNHPNIVAVYDVGESRGTPYIISELLQGETLRDRLAGGTLPGRKVADYGVQILRGLAAAHDKGIVHRDLKPENLFLTKDGLVKILDFGVAKLGRGDEVAGTDVETVSRTTPGGIVGTVGYMSPEQVRGLPVDARSDLFSLGAVFFEMLTGRRAFKGQSAADTLSAILREDPTDGPQNGPAIPPALLRVIRRSLEKSPEDRFQNARDMAFALEEATNDTRTTFAETLAETPRHRSSLVPRLATALALVAVGGAAFAARGLLSRDKPLVSFRRLSFRPGQISAARFAADGDTIVYSAKWGKSATELFSARASAHGELPLGIKDALVLSLSATGRMALLLKPRAVTWGVSEGELAIAPMAGGTPREVLEGVLSADWSPDEKDLAVTHVVEEDKYRIEYPIGHVLYAPEPPVWISKLRVSPDGEQVAFLEHPVPGDKEGSVAIVDRKGQKRTLAAGLSSTNTLAWASGDEVWFDASTGNGTPNQIRGVSVTGRQRLVEESPGLELRDVSKAGLVLADRVTEWTEVRAKARGASEESELAASDLAYVSDLSDDGREVLGTDIGESAGPNFRFYVQKTDGSPALWLGEGDGQALSPDGRMALAVLEHKKPQQLVIVPTGAGETRSLSPGPVTQYQRAVWDNTGRRVVFSGIDGQSAMRVYVQDVDGGVPRAITPEDVGLAMIGRPVSPDGMQLVAMGPDGVPVLYPLAGGEERAIPGLGGGDVVICWAPGGRELLVARYDIEVPWALPRIDRVELASGHSRPLDGLGLSAPSALLAQSRVLVTPDGGAYAYNYTRSLSDLYLITNLK